MQRAFVVAGVAMLVATVAVVLLVEGTDAEGFGAAIRATARTSALCAGLAFARVRVRELGVLLVVSQALHYTMILIGGRDPDAASLVVGVAIFTVMVWNAVRPNAVAIWILWIAFLVAVGTNRGGAPVYIAMTALLLLAGVARWARRGAPASSRPLRRHPAGSSSRGAA